MSWQLGSPGNAADAPTVAAMRTALGALSQTEVDARVASVGGPLFVGALPNQTAVVYVSKTGSDANNGLALDRPKLTITSALTAAAALVVAGAERAHVNVLDSADYLENLTITAGLGVFAPNATLIGEHTIQDNGVLYAFRIIRNLGTADLLEKLGSGSHAHVRCHIADTRGILGGLTGNAAFRNQSSGSVLHVHCDVLFVGESTIGLADGSGGGDFGHLHFLGSDIYLAGNNAMGCRTGSAGSKILINCDHILKIGTPNNTTAADLNHASSEVWLRCAQIIADNAWDINSGNLYVACPDIRGTKDGVPVVDLVAGVGVQAVIQFAIGDETSDITTGEKISFRMPFAMTLQEVRASLEEAPTGSPAEFDINQGGSSVLGTVISIDAGETTSETAATPPVINTTALTDDAVITVDIDQKGSTNAGKGPKITLKGIRTN